MKLTEEKLREIYQKRTSRSARKQTGCLTEEQFLSAALGEMGKVELQRAALHMITCSDCTEEYRIACSLKSVSDGFGEAVGPVVQEASGPRKVLPLRNLLAQPAWLKAAVVAAMAVIVVGGSLLLLRDLRPVEPSRPASRGDFSSGMKVEPPDRATLSAPPERFAWSAQSLAERYEVTLYDIESTLVWQSPPVTGTFVEVPEKVRQSVKRGEPYYWRVTAYDAVERRQSELFQFVISR